MLEEEAFRYRKGWSWNGAAHRRDVLQHERHTGSNEEKSGTDGSVEPFWLSFLGASMVAVWREC